jgi:hypothetical protein
MAGFSYTLFILGIMPAWMGWIYAASWIQQWVPTSNFPLGVAIAFSTGLLTMLYQVQVLMVFVQHQKRNPELPWQGWLEPLQQNMVKLGLRNWLAYTMASSVLWTIAAVTLPLLTS